MAATMVVLCVGIAINIYDPLLNLQQRQQPEQQRQQDVISVYHVCIEMLIGIDFLYKQGALPVGETHHQTAKRPCMFL